MNCKVRAARVAGFLLALVVIAAPLSAQVFTPSFLAPRTSSDVGLYLNDGPGDFSVEGIWRRGYGEFDLGLRAGLASTNDVSILLGADYRRPIAVGAPLALAATGSAQGVLGEFSGAGFLAGLSVGPTFASEGATFTPYVHPRVGIVQGLVGGDWDLELLADLGFDLRLGGLDVRFGASFADVGADWGVGVAWR